MGKIDKVVLIGGADIRTRLLDEITMEQMIRKILGRDISESSLRAGGHHIFLLLFLALLLAIVVLSFAMARNDSHVTHLAAVLSLLILAELNLIRLFRKVFSFDETHLVNPPRASVNLRSEIRREADGAHEDLDVEKEIVVRMEPKSRQTVKLHLTRVKRAEPKVIYDLPDQP